MIDSKLNYISKEDKTQHKINQSKNLKFRVILFVLAAIIGFGVKPAIVFAVNYNEQIQQLRADNQQKANQQAVLSNEAASFQDKIDGLQTQIRILEEQIQKDQAASNDLQAKILVKEQELEVQKEVLGQNIRAMYTEGDISTFEMLASSRNLSEFADKEQYRNSLNTKIKSILDKINAIKHELDSQKELLNKTISINKERQGSLDSQRAEVAALLAMNSTQRSALESQIASNNSQISKLRYAQAASNAKLFGGGLRNIPDTSGYPWANFNPFPNSVADPWGMYLRQCVSYTAWKVWKSGRYMPYWGGHGNANKWDENARADGIQVDGNPRAGDVGISNAGYYGHAVYVEHVYGDGNILISQYNASWDGRYSEAVVSAGKFVYIHF